MPPKLSKRNSQVGFVEERRPERRAEEEVLYDQDHRNASHAEDTGVAGSYVYDIEDSKEAFGSYKPPNDETEAEEIKEGLEEMAEEFKELTNMTGAMAHSATSSLEGEDAKAEEWANIHESLADSVKHSLSRINPEFMTDTERMLIHYGFSKANLEEEVNEDEARAREKAKEFKGCRLWCLKASRMKCFGFFFGMLIVINTITMGVELEVDADTKAELDKFGNVFTFFFLVEIIIRLIGSPTPIFKDTFLMFDTIIVAATTIEAWVLVPIREAMDENESFNLSFLASLRMFRMIRFIRIFRLVAFLRPVRVLLQSAYGALSDLIWVMVLFNLTFFVFGLMFRTLLRDLDKTHPNYHIREMYFESTFGTMLTLLEAMTGGVEWSSAIARPMLSNDDTWTFGILWLAYVFVSIFCMSNIVVAVFVEGYQNTAKADDWQVRKEKFVNSDANPTFLKELFESLDVDGDGCISWEEFKQGCKRSHGDSSVLEALKIDMTEAELLFREIDWNRDNNVKVDDFLFGVVTMKGISKNVDMMSLNFQLKKVLQQTHSKFENIEKLDERIDELKDFLAKTFDTGGRAVGQKDPNEELQNTLKELSHGIAEVGHVIRSRGGSSAADEWMKECTNLRSELHAMHTTVEAVRADVDLWKR